MHFILKVLRYMFQIMNVRLPNFGEYKLDIYETTETGALIHVNTYNLWRARADEIPVICLVIELQIFGTDITCS